MAAYEEFEIEAGEVLDLGNGVTFAVLLQDARPAGSRGQVQIRYGAVTVWAEGLIVRITNYADVDEARAAAERLAHPARSVVARQPIPRHEPAGAGAQFAPIPIEA